MAMTTDAVGMHTRHGARLRCRKTGAPKRVVRRVGDSGDAAWQEDAISAQGPRFFKHARVKSWRTRRRRRHRGYANVIFIAR